MSCIKKSIEIIKKNQSENGAYVASPNFDSYNYSWFRDGAYIAYSMNISEEHESARKFHLWCSSVMGRYGGRVKSILKEIENGGKLNESQFLPTRFNLEGIAVEDEWTNFQTDGFGTWLWALSQHIELGNDKKLLEQIRESVTMCIEYLLAVWQIPCYDCWEEHLGYIHTYTLGSIYAGLESIKKYFPLYKEKIDLATADIKKFIQDHLIKDNQLIKMIDANGKETDKTNGVDASLLGMFVPYNIFDCNGKIAKMTIQRIEKDIYREEGGVYRYLEDTYFGGGEWILLSCWLGWYYVKANQEKKAEKILEWADSHFDEDYQLPEIVLENVFEKDKLYEWEKRWGKNAKPLLWSHAMYIILTNVLTSPIHTEHTIG